MKATAATSSIRALRNSVAALASRPRTGHRVSAEHLIQVPDFDNEHNTGTECSKAKYKFIKFALQEYLVRATGNNNAGIRYTPRWRYNNCWRAIIVGWPEKITWMSLSKLKGHDTSYDTLIGLLHDGYLFIRIASPGEWALHQAAGAAKDIAISSEPRNTAPRGDISHHRSASHTRPKLRPVRDIPKSPEFVESDIEEFEEVPGMAADDIEDFSD